MCKHGHYMRLVCRKSSNDKGNVMQKCMCLRHNTRDTVFSPGVGAGHTLPARNDVD